jgi:hypothetical protein
MYETSTVIKNEDANQEENDVTAAETKTSPEDETTTFSTEQATFCLVFSFAETRKTRFLIALAFISAIISGLTLPAKAYLFARVFGDLSGDTVDNGDFWKTFGAWLLHSWHSVPFSL